MKIEKITITPDELDIIMQALDELSQSFITFSESYPDECNKSEIDSQVMSIRKVIDIIYYIRDNSPLNVEVSSDD